MDVRALVFDVFGTVVDWRDGVARDVRRLLPGVDGEAFADTWRERYVPSMDRVRRGEREWANPRPPPDSVSPTCARASRCGR